jgi:hypothetical protein
MTTRRSKRYDFTELGGQRSYGMPVGSSHDWAEFIDRFQVLSFNEPL